MSKSSRLAKFSLAFVAGQLLFEKSEKQLKNELYGHFFYQHLLQQVHTRLCVMGL